MYSKTVLDHFRNPRNVGVIDDPDGVGELGNPMCGDIMTIYLKIENLCLECIILTITAALENQNNKLIILKSNRIKIELLKNLIRIIYELNIINYKQYIDLESDLQEISKMTNGWIKYLDTKKFQ